MKPNPNPLSDITRSSLDDMVEGVNIGQLNTRDNRRVLASGDLRALSICDGLVVMVGYLKGQSAYNAKGFGMSGLSVEVRLDGHSASCRVNSNGEKNKIGPGQYGIVASRESSEWDVTAPEQAIFRSVSINYSREFLDSIGDPVLARFIDELFETEIRHGGTATAGVLSMAEQLCMLLEDQPLVTARGRWLSLGVLTEICADAIESRGAAEPNPDSLFTFARRFVCQNIGADITIEDVAKHCRTSPATLKTVFRSIEGKSLGTFMRQQRMIAAQHMLNRGIPIAGVARTLRYSASESFSRAFKRHFGYSPSKNGRSFLKVSD